MKRINVLVRQDQYKSLKLMAQNEETSVSTLIRDFVDFGVQEKMGSAEAPGEVLLTLAKSTFRDRRDVAKNHDRFLYA